MRTRVQKAGVHMRLLCRGLRVGVWGRVQQHTHSMQRCEAAVDRAAANESSCAPSLLVSLGLE